MGKYAIIHKPTAGTRLKADYGRDVANSIRSQQFALRDGQRVSVTSNGTRVEFDQTTQKTTDLTTPVPFSCTWQQFGESSDDGQWQIYLPHGCVTLNQMNVAETYVPVNDDGKSSNSEPAWQWYKIPTPNDKDAREKSWGGYIAKEWTVYVHIKPWARMKVSTESEDKSFGKVHQSVAVATIGEISFENQKWRFATKLTEKASVSVERGTTSPFSLYYEMESTEKRAKPIVWVRNQSLPVGRNTISLPEATDATGWEQVWVRINHKEELATIEVINENYASGESSDDDKTLFRVYSLKDDVAIEDLRANMPILDFYTAAPDSGEQ